MSKNKKNEPVAVNPIVFNCNELTERRVEATIGNKDQFIINGVHKVLRDEKSLYTKRRLKVLPLSVYAYEKITKEKVDLDGALGCPINSYLCDAYIYPSPNCKIRKLSARATQFLLSLGVPSDELRCDYRTYLCDMASKNPEECVIPGISSGFHEELLELPINGHTEYIYVLASTEMCYVIHRRHPKHGENEFFNIPIHISNRNGKPVGPAQEYNADYKNKETGAIFDVEALLANLWISETLRTCEPLNHFAQLCTMPN